MTHESDQAPGPAPRAAIRQRVKQAIQECLARDGGGDDTWLCQDCAEALLAAELDRLTRERDKWLEAFNRSEQFQSGPTTQAEAEVDRLTRRAAGLRTIAEKWLRRTDCGFDPEEAEVTTAYWQGARRCAEELLAALALPGSPPPHEADDREARVNRILAQAQQIATVAERAVSGRWSQGQIEEEIVDIVNAALKQQAAAREGGR